MDPEVSAKRPIANGSLGLCFSIFWRLWQSLCFFIPAATFKQARNFLPCAEA